VFGPAAGMLVAAAATTQMVRITERDFAKWIVPLRNERIMMAATVVVPAGSAYGTLV